MNSRPGVYVLDDDQAVRSALLHLISAAGHRAVGYANAEQFLDSEAYREPGCLLLDLCLPDMSGIELLEQLNTRGSTVPVVFMSGFGDVPLTVRAMKLGAIDFLTKPVHDTDLFSAIDNALLIDDMRRGQRVRVDDVRARIDSLTRREHDVLNGVLLGRLNKQIARELGISEKTVKVHRGRVMTKMGVRRVAQLAQLAAQIDYQVIEPSSAPPPRIVSRQAWRRRAPDISPQQISS